MQNLFFLFLILTSLSAAAQSSSDSIQGNDEPLLFVEESPKFDGDLHKFLRKNLKYPKEASKSKIQGIVYVNFVVERDGSISDVAVQKGIPGYGLDEEAVRVVKLMPPWKPGKNNGMPVKSRYAMPINFRSFTYY